MPKNAMTRDDTLDLLFLALLALVAVMIDLGLIRT